MFVYEVMPRTHPEALELLLRSKEKQVKFMFDVLMACKDALESSERTGFPRKRKLALELIETYLR